MKKTTKILFLGAGVAAAARLAYVMDNEVFEKAADKAKKIGYRANTKVMEKGLPLVDIAFPGPKLVSGANSSNELPAILEELGVTRAMIVTGPTVGKTIVPPIMANIESAGIACEVYSKVEANPSVNTIEAIRELYINTGCNGFLAIGGGSPMDAAKAAAARVAKPNTPIGKMSGLFKVLRKVDPIIAVPTTSGTGSEATMGAVISDHEEHHKYAIMDSFLVPKYAVLDPVLTVSMPPFVTATTGVDALTHAVESYITWAYNTNESNRNAEAAVVKIFRNLERAYADGSDLEAREEMLIASYRAALAFNRTAVGYIHAIAHAMGGIYNTAHGLANAVIMPIVLEDYGEVVHPQLAHLAEITGIKTSGSDAEKAAAFINAIRELNKKMGLPTGFDFIEQKDFPQIIEWALAEGNKTYPVPVIYNEARMRHVLNRIVLEA